MSNINNPDRETTRKTVDKAVGQAYGITDDLVDAVLFNNEQLLPTETDDQPRLGLATTRQLLDELFARFQTEGGSAYTAGGDPRATVTLQPTLDLDYSTVAGERGIHLEDSPHVSHAIRELELSGQRREDPAYAASIVRVVKEFFSHGHSGESAEMAIRQLEKLLRGEALTPLTDHPNEWEDRSKESGRPWWQNRRDSRAMSHDQGKTFWLVDDAPTAPGGTESYGYTLNNQEPPSKRMFLSQPSQTDPDQEQP